MQYNKNKTNPNNSHFNTIPFIKSYITLLKEIRLDTQAKIEALNLNKNSEPNINSIENETTFFLGKCMMVIKSGLFPFVTLIDKILPYNITIKVCEILEQKTGEKKLLINARELIKEIKSQIFTDSKYYNNHKEK